MQDVMYLTCITDTERGVVNDSLPLSALALTSVLQWF